MPESNVLGTVVLVGAGPGDPGLLTVKGKSWLQRANVVVYDQLANSKLLRYAPKNAERLFAGKSSGKVTFQQDEMNRLLIDKARQGKTVVRLKGGDPFIFGRGGEEAQALKQAGVPFVIVPGVTSPIGVSAYAGIPLTHRDCASSVSIITGITGPSDPDEIRINWEKIAERSGTLVFLMGARKLPEIVANLTRYGKNPETPVAVIQWGTTPWQKTWTGKLNTIVEIATREKIKPPALTIIGEVVDLKESIDWFESYPLFGKSVVVTRPEDQSQEFLELLADRGAAPIAYPVIETVAPDDWSPLDRVLEGLAEYDGLIFTSVNGVRYFRDRLYSQGYDIRELKGVRLYAIGTKTAAAVELWGIRVDVVPEKFVAESLLDSMGEENVKGKRFLLPRAKVARETLPEELRARGAVVDVVPAYQTLPPKNRETDLAERIREGRVDVVTFTSSSTVTEFVKSLPEETRKQLDRVTFACIGPITAKTAEKQGLRVDIMPEQYTIESLVSAMETFFLSKE